MFTYVRTYVRVLRKAYVRTYVLRTYVRRPLALKGKQAPLPPFQDLCAIKKNKRTDDVRTYLCTYYGADLPGTLVSFARTAGPAALCDNIRPVFPRRA